MFVHFCCEVCYIMDNCHCFPQCMAIIPLIGGLTGGVMTRNCSGYWAGLLLFGCLLPSCCSRCSQICFLALSDLPQGLGGIGALLVGEKTLRTPLLELFTGDYAFCVTFQLLSRLTLGPTFTIGMPATDPCDSQALFAPCHQLRSTEVRSRMAVVLHLYPLWKLWRQLRLWPDMSPMCTCPQSLPLLKLDLPQLQEHLLSIQMFVRCWS